MSTASDVTTADFHLREVEEQLENIFTPTPIELLKVTLRRPRETDDFGFSLSDGVFEKGVYVGAVRPDGPAAGALKPYDRVLQVNISPTDGLRYHLINFFERFITMNRTRILIVDQ